LEYAFTNNPDSCPFCLYDLHLLWGTTQLDPYAASKLDIRTATHVTLEFTNNNKKEVRGELIGLG
jgi:hypothetical protein